MWNHFPRMYEKMQKKGIPFPRFTSNEMAELIAYVYFVGYFDEPITPADKLKGKILFREKQCAVCHSISGVGGHIGPDLTRWQKYDSPILWAQLMWNHLPAMSEKMREKSLPWPRFKNNEMRDLIAYIYGANGGPQEQTRVLYTLPGNPARGKELFEEKKCINCHSIFGIGGSVGPSLTSTGYNRTIIQLAGVMWNHAPAMLQKMEEEGIEKPQFNGKEMADVIAYLFFLGYFDQPGDPVEGREVFARKGCIKCHTVRHEGGNLGPDLTKYGNAGEPLQPVLIVQAMWSHAPLMAKAMKEKKIPWPRLDEYEMIDLIAFLRNPAAGKYIMRITPPAAANAFHPNRR